MKDPKMNRSHNLPVGLVAVIAGMTLAVTSVSAQPTGMKFLPIAPAEQDAQNEQNDVQDDSEAEPTMSLPTAGPNHRLLVDPLTGEKRVDIRSLICSSYTGEPIPEQHHNNPIYLQWHVLDLSEEQFEKIRTLYELDSIMAAKMGRALLKEAQGYYQKGFKKDDPEVAGALEAMMVNRHEYYLLTQSRNEDISKILTAEQVERLKEQSMYIGVGEFGGPIKFFETAFAQKGLRAHELTPEQKQALDDALADYVRTMRKANAELVERAIQALPDEYRNAVIDAAGIRGLEKKKDGD